MSASEILTVALALATAATWALTSQFQKKGLSGVDGRTGALIVISSFAAFFWGLAPFLIEWHWFGTRAAVIFAISGLVVPGLAQQFQMLSIEKLGPTLTAMVGAFASVFAVVPALLFLDEHLNFRSGLGIVVMVVGVVLFDRFVFKHDRIGGDHLAAAILTTLGAVVLITSQN